MYEVYICKHNEVIVYIGKGNKGRHKHCISGCSHVFGLNKIFFTEGVDSLDVVVVKEFSSNQEAMELEKYLTSLIRRLRYDGIGYSCKSNIYTVFYYTMLEEFNVDLQNCFIADLHKYKKK